MKKQLLLLMAAIMGGAGSSFAYEDGDFVYTHSGKYRIVGNNLVVNGDFSKNFTGWTNIAGDAVQDGDFTIVTGGGPDGQNCIRVENGMPDGQAMGTNLDNSADIRQAVELQAGQTYVAVYRIRSNRGGVSSNARFGGRNDNYQDVYHKPDADPCFVRTSEGVTDTYDDVVSIAEWISPKAGEWTEVAYAYTAGTSTEYLTFEFFNLMQSDMFTDFGIYRAELQDDDERITNSIVESLNGIRTLFEEEGASDFSLLDDIITYAAEDPLTDVIEYVEGEDDDFASFLQDNGYANAAIGPNYDYVKTFTFNDEATKSANKGAATNWTETGGRWGVRAPWSNFIDNSIFCEISAKYALGTGSQYQTVSLPAGRYFYMVKASGWKYYGNGSGSSSNYYITDFYNELDSVMGFFINGDTVWMADVPTWYGKYYYAVFDVPADGEQTIGFCHKEVPAFSGNDRYKTSGGGLQRFDNIHLYALNVSEEDLETFYLQNNVNIARADLQTSIDAVTEALADSKYIFYKETLRDTLDAAKVACAITEPTQANIDNLNDWKSRLDATYDVFGDQNAEYVELGTTIETANGLYVDESRPKGKEALKSAIDVAQNVYDAVVASESHVADSANLVNATDNLNTAIQTFYYDNATYQVPASVLIQNADFADNDANWTNDNPNQGNANARWKFGTVETPYGSYRAMYYNRGNIAADDKWLYQDVKIEKEGVYDFIAILAVHNSTWGDPEGHDSYTYLYTSVDSVNVITKGANDPKNQVLGEFGRFNVESIVNDLNDERLPAPGYLRIGLEKRKDANGANTQINMIYFVNPTLYYYGSEEDYKSGIYDVEKVDLNSTFDVYNLSGMKVRSNVNSLEGLGKGIYIVNGKKYVVK